MHASGRKKLEEKITRSVKKNISNFMNIEAFQSVT